MKNIFFFSLFALISGSAWSQQQPMSGYIDCFAKINPLLSSDSSNVGIRCHDLYKGLYFARIHLPTDFHFNECFSSDTEKDKELKAAGVTYLDALISTPVSKGDGTNPEGMKIGSDNVGMIKLEVSENKPEIPSAFTCVYGRNPGDYRKFNFFYNCYDCQN